MKGSVTLVHSSWSTWNNWGTSKIQNANANSVSSSDLRNNENYTSLTWSLWLFQVMKNGCRELNPLLWISCQRSFWEGTEWREITECSLWYNSLIQGYNSQASQNIFGEEKKKKKDTNPFFTCCWHEISSKCTLIFLLKNTSFFSGKIRWASLHM